MGTSLQLGVQPGVGNVARPLALALLAAGFDVDGGGAELVVVPDPTQAFHGLCLGPDEGRAVERRRVWGLGCCRHARQAGPGGAARWDDGRVRIEGWAGPDPAQALRGFRRERRRRAEWP